jgi:[lysine-biosynthesis-protein LysW]--L-2-aminoadipate ligase
VVAAIGVLSSRTRVEEKQLFAALAVAGVSAMPLSPTRPLPLPPTPDTDSCSPTVIIDRCRDRALAAAALPVWQALGVTVLDAGMAATSSRAAVAAALSAAGLPRPTTYLTLDEASAMAALAATGFPATLLPLVSDQAAIILHDQDAAEAVVEHRTVLGGMAEATALVQAGAPDGAVRTTILVVGGIAVASSSGDSWATAAATLAIAETASRVLGASVIGVELAATTDGVVIWDVQPVPDFRSMSVLSELSPAEAIAALAAGHLARLAPPPPSDAAPLPVEIVALDADSNRRQEVAGGVALSA